MLSSSFRLRSSFITSFFYYLNHQIFKNHNNPLAVFSLVAKKHLIGKASNGRRIFIKFWPQWLRLFDCSTTIRRFPQKPPLFVLFGVPLDITSEIPLLNLFHQTCLHLSKWNNDTDLMVDSPFPVLKVWFWTNWKKK